MHKETSVCHDIYGILKRGIFVLTLGDPTEKYIHSSWKSSLRKSSPLTFPVAQTRSGSLVIQRHMGPITTIPVSIVTSLWCNMSAASRMLCSMSIYSKTLPCIPCTAALGDYNVYKPGAHCRFTVLKRGHEQR